MIGTRIVLTDERGQPVQKIIVPPFLVMPKAIQWGERFFFRTEIVTRGPDRASEWEYREGFLYAIATQEETKPVEG